MNQLVPSEKKLQEPQLVKSCLFIARPSIISDACGAIVKGFVWNEPVLSFIATKAPDTGVGKVTVNDALDVLHKYVVPEIPFVFDDIVWTIYGEGNAVYESELPFETNVVFAAPIVFKPVPPLTIGRIPLTPVINEIDGISALTSTLNVGAAAEPDVGPANTVLAV